MDKILEQTLLYDFYGELLTDHQKQIYEDVVLNDYSFSEVAEEKGISRQGVHDAIARAEQTLCSLEERMHCVARARAAQEALARICAQAETLSASQDPAARAAKNGCGDNGGQRVPGGKGIIRRAGNQ